MKLGLKLWSTNTSLLTEAQELFAQKYFSYIELFAVPDSYNQTIAVWKNAQIPFVVHAAHSMSGLNFSLKENSEKNKKLAEEAKQFADTLKAETIIFHPGINGKLEETVRQAKQVFDSCCIMENKPALGLNGEQCLGSTPAEIAKLLQELSCGFCLDFGHAIAAANTHKIEPMVLIRSFMELNPVMFHLTDGDYKSEKDNHFHYGEGNFPLEKLISLLPDEAMVTNEAKRESKDSLQEIIGDFKYTKSITS